MADDERARQKTLPPDEFRFGDPAGAIQYAEVFDGDGLAGWVWCAISRDARPRAGILLVAVKRRDPSTDFQNDLGEVTLRLRSSGQVDARRFLDYLGETRDGHGGVMVGDIRQCSSMAAMRQIAEQFPNA